MRFFSLFRSGGRQPGSQPPEVYIESPDGIGILTSANIYFAQDDWTANIGVLDGKIFKEDLYRYTRH